MLRDQADTGDPHFAARVRTILDVHRLLGKRGDLARRLAELLHGQGEAALKVHPGWIKEFLSSLEDLALSIDERLQLSGPCFCAFDFLKAPKTVFKTEA